MAKKRGFVVFTRRFLNCLTNREPAPLSSQEAFWSGPWLVGHKGKEFTVYRTSDSTPAAYTQYRETALLLAAALPIIGRGPLYWFADERNQAHGMFDLLTTLGEKGVDVVGRVEYRQEEILGSLSTLEFLLRSPESLSYMIEAASPDLLRRVDRLIDARLEKAPQGSRPGLS